MNVTIKVNGMMCEHCKKKVEKTLKGIKGVKKIKVNLDNKEVSFVFKEEKVDINTIKLAIVQQGYEVE